MIRICNKICINNFQTSNITHILYNLFKIAVDVHNTSFSGQTDGPTNGKAKGLLLIFTHADEMRMKYIFHFYNLILQISQHVRILNKFYFFHRY